MSMPEVGKEGKCSVCGLRGYFCRKCKSFRCWQHH